MRLPLPLATLRRSLSFRLTASFLAFFTLLLVLIGILFRNMLLSIQRTQMEEVLEVDWAALKGYLTIQNGKVVWTGDAEDPEDAFVLARLKNVFLLADDRGQVVEMSPAYRLLGPDPPEEIRKVLQSGEPIWRVRRDPWGVSYYLRSGVYEEGRRRYYISMGRSLTMNEALVHRFTWRYFSTLPLILLIGGLLGWFLTKRGLKPLHDVVRASETITSSNLSLRIPPTGAKDELDRLIETFNRMIERLDRSFQQMKQFTTDVSHELRTPITAVRGQLEVALMSSRSEEDLREAVSTALEETERLSNVVRAMLALSQAESGQLALRRERHDLARLAEEIMDQFRIPAEEAQVSLLADLAPGCEAEVDQVQFERLVSNLLSNAVKYTPAGGEVRLTLRPGRSSVVMVVEDTGCGIPREHLPRIFERFYRVPGNGLAQKKGLGLGLSFVSWIVKAHGGAIDVSSEPGKGTRFTVTLPKEVPRASVRA